jgi:transposase
VQQQATQTKPTYAELEAKVLKLETELVYFRRLIFGQKRERFVPAQQEDQLSFLISTDEKERPVETEYISYSRTKPSKKRKHPGRSSLPESLPRKEIILEPEEDVSGCKKIGEEITEELEYEPPKFYVNRYIRPKYARPKDEGIAIAILPFRPIDKGIAGPGLLGHILISKFVDHIPLYRQRGQFRRLGVDISDSTIGGWVLSTCELLTPLFNLLRDNVLSSNYLMVDETTIKVLDPLLKGKTHQGYYWVYYDPLGEQVFFDYQKGRGRDGPNNLLKNFAGHLQTDGYKAYGDLAARKCIISLGCWAHARRYFVEALDNGEKKASWVLECIQKLYEIERIARESDFSYEERYQLRQEKAPHIMKEIKAWLNIECLVVLPKSALGKAIQYILNQWDRLQVYLTDGRLEIDNNLVENAIRPVALGRKNYLFAGSHDSARRAAIVYSIVSTAKLQGIEPYFYLRDIISRIPQHPFKHLDQLLPKNWKLKN